jgi:hypothetical protein
VEGLSKLVEGKSKLAGKEIQSRVKKNPNIFFPPIEVFQRLKPQIQGKASLSILRLTINKTSTSNSAKH